VTTTDPAAARRPTTAYRITMTAKPIVLEMSVIELVSARGFGVA
jgi:hypothetical protein